MSAPRTDPGACADSPIPRDTDPPRRNRPARRGFQEAYDSEPGDAVEKEHTGPCGESARAHEHGVAGRRGLFLFGTLSFSDSLTAPSWEATRPCASGSSNRVVVAVVREIPRRTRQTVNEGWSSSAAAGARGHEDDEKGDRRRKRSTSRSPTTDGRNDRSAMYMALLWNYTVVILSRENLATTPNTPTAQGSVALVLCVSSTNVIHM